MQQLEGRTHHMDLLKSGICIDCMVQRLAMSSILKREQIFLDVCDKSSKLRYVLQITMTSQLQSAEKILFVHDLNTEDEIMITKVVKKCA